ncbi:MAG: hypothetical protein QOE03_3264 [Micromonosporaceae bacterium]|nr:hypothetical protein [Micromonosporaceae bacterium]
MRRIRTAVALGFVAVLLVSGCAGARPPGVDGNLTDGWPTMPDPTLPVPADHACYAPSDPSSRTYQLPAPVGCDTRHTLETIHIGMITGDDAAGDLPPPAGGPAQQREYGDCANVARDFVGDDWRTGRIGLDVVLPTAAQWDADARWYRCDLVEFTDLDSYEVAERTASLRGALAGARPLALTCFAVTTKADAVDTMGAVDCGTGHNGEFAGVWEAPPGGYPADDAQREKTELAGCRSVVASFAGVPNDDKLRYRVGQITFGFGKGDWDLGNRGVRCYIWMDGKNLTRSLKGAGTGALPIN